MSIDAKHPSVFVKKIAAENGIHAENIRIVNRKWLLSFLTGTVDLSGDNARFIPVLAAGLRISPADLVDVQDAYKPNSMHPRNYRMRDKRRELSRVRTA